MSFISRTTCRTLEYSLLCFFSFFDNLNSSLFDCSFSFHHTITCPHIFHRYPKIVIEVYLKVFITSNTGKPLLILNSYISQLNKSTINMKYWKCEVKTCSISIRTLEKVLGPRYSDGCPATIIVYPRNLWALKYLVSIPWIFWYRAEYCFDVFAPLSNEKLILVCS